MAKRKIIQDVNYGRQCSWNDHGLRCEREGYLSDTLLGQGPWYCRDHYADLKHWSRVSNKKAISIAVEEMTKDLREPYRAYAVERQKATADIESMSEIDKRVNKLVPHLTGESEHDWSMRCRTWSLEQMKRKRSQIEPGESG